jgi:hypothetical protein
MILSSLQSAARFSAPPARKSPPNASAAKNFAPLEEI